MKFTTEMLVRFHHCDPAGIVFYPRYFEMVNMVVEDWFAQALGASFPAMSAERGTAVPTVHVECDFVRVSQVGEVLIFELEVERLGTTSFTIQVRALRDGELRLRARAVLVYVLLGNRYGKTPIDADIRARMQDYVVAGAAGGTD
ncbi:MAG: acyl-CoA thioesterase [Gammaproteobacteria bacterium]|nr:acyl-CoA thioesterase [Gammaproteobacteria bacterium]